MLKEFQNREQLKTNKHFNRDLLILMQAYLNIGQIIEKIEVSLDSQLKNKIQKTTVDAVKFYRNGQRLSRLFLGTENQYTRIFNKCFERLRRLHPKESPLEVHRPIGSPIRHIETGNDTTNELSTPKNAARIRLPLTSPKKREKSKDYVIRKSLNASNHHVNSDYVFFYISPNISPL